MNTILAAPDESFRARAHERLLEAGCESVRIVDRASTLTSALEEDPQAVVITGDDWASARPFVQIAARAKARSLVLLEHPTTAAADPRPQSAGQNHLTRTPLAARTALASGAHGALNANISPTSLAAALEAIQANLLVLDQSLDPGARMSDATDLGAHDELPEPGRPASRPLTSRERQILSLIASGISNKGVARSLGVSTNTVKFHLAAAFDKLNATTRAEAVAEAIRRGELSL